MFISSKRMTNMRNRYMKTLAAVILFLVLLAVAVVAVVSLHEPPVVPTGGVFI